VFKNITKPDESTPHPDIILQYTPSYYVSNPCLTPLVFSFVGVVCYSPSPNMLLYPTYLLLSNLITLPPLLPSISCKQANNKQTQIICYFLSLGLKYYSQHALVKDTQYMKRDVFTVVIYRNRMALEFTNNVNLHYRWNN
jgi:hypothetical protein